MASLCMIYFIYVRMWHHYVPYVISMSECESLCKNATSLRKNVKSLYIFM